jgi:hypothetical protein
MAMDGAGTRQPVEKPRIGPWIKRGCGLLLVLGLCAVVLLIGSTRRKSHATLRILDEANSPVSGAVIRPIAIKASDGIVYPWRADEWEIPISEQRTDQRGMAYVKCPRYASRGVVGIELQFEVSHPDYGVSDAWAPYQKGLIPNASWIHRLLHAAYELTHSRIVMTIQLQRPIKE